MSTMMPQVPPRPQRVQEQPPATGATLGSEMPKIPPRPLNRRLDRSISPHRESYARSPLNESPFLGNAGNTTKTSLYASESANSSSADLPRRPPSVSLPSIGQEGSEYASAFEAPEELGTSPTQLRNIGGDLKLHAPKPSLPVSSAKQRVSTVTRTDSGQAAAFGIGRTTSNDDKDPTSRPLKAKASFASQTSTSTERRPSSVDSEHGIPEIGQRVPMYPHAGDVQAPSPSPFAQQYPPGIGFHNDGSKPRHHGRRASARGHDIPADAYGRYGHGVIPHDRFEKAYYEKHPELFKKELGQYGEGRPEWAMSSEDLNKIVRDTASRGAGLGTSPAVMGTPSEQVGFQASEEYTSRMSSPRPQSSGFPLTHSNASETQVDSPLRKESVPIDATAKSEFEGTLSRSLNAPSDSALSSEVEDDDVIHVDDPGRRYNKIYGGDNTMQSAEDLGTHTEIQDDNDHYGAPILASDEVAKEPFGWELLPAVSRSAYDEPYSHHRSGSASSGSKPSSRPGSIHGAIPGLRLPESTPLEDLDEYEPLFPEDKPQSAHQPITSTDKLKRPELKNRKFPSQDIWEDTPNSLQYTATVSTPQLPEDTEDSPIENTETPEQAFARRQEELAERESFDTESFLHRETKPWAHKPHLAADTRYVAKQRFPSRDIWEDTPDSLQLETTVAGPQSDDQETSSPVAERPKDATAQLLSEKPQVPARPVKSKLPESPEKTQPIIPERPARIRQVDGAATVPPPPAKSKPQVPARPSKPIARESSENVPLTSVLSNSSAKSIGSDTSSANVAKPKPPVPSRPLGSKIAALQGGFMSDLNKRLQLGPQAPRKEEPAPEEKEVEKDKIPLVDARKSRARGPARRAPAKSPAPATVETAEPTAAFSLSSPITAWEIDPEEDFVYVVAPTEEKILPVSQPTKPTELETPTLATNTAGETVHDASEIALGTEKELSLPSATGDALAETGEEHEKETVIHETEGKNHKIEPVKKSDELPAVHASTLHVPEPDDEEDLAASTATLKPGKEIE